ncbi:MAG: sulfotransferase [Bacteroidetes bacterium]|nr:sulfotransferase [Bacteroidota bacterium]
MLTNSIDQIKAIQIHFIVSTGRTGSTLLSAMFNMHKNIVSPVEEPFAFNLYYKYGKITNWTSKIIDEYCYDFYLFSEGVLEAQFGSRKELQETLEKYKDDLDYHTAVKITYLCFFPERDKSNVTTIIDKQLKFHDFIEKVAVFFPESKFIILNRDPRDNALVKMKRILREKEKGLIHRQNKSNYWMLALIWERVYSLIYTKRDRIGSDRFMELKYEDLVADPERELMRIASFTGFEYDPVMLQYHEHTKDRIAKADEVQDVKKQMFYQLHQGLTQRTNTDKVGFWKTEMKANDSDIVWSICSKLALQIGYTVDGSKNTQPRTREFYRTYFTFLIQNIIIPKIYYGVPFWVRYSIKKFKYGNRFKQNRYTSERFQETTK